MSEFLVLLDKRRKYKASLPCPKDGTSLLYNCLRVGVRFVAGQKGKPERIWNADLYHCPTCHNLVLTDFGSVSQWNKKNTTNLITKIAELQLVDPVLYQWQFKNGIGTYRGTL